jgi:hypothetical protein
MTSGTHLAGAALTASLLRGFGVEVGLLEGLRLGDARHGHHHLRPRQVPPPPLGLLGAALQPPHPHPLPALSLPRWRAQARRGSGSTGFTSTPRPPSRTRRTPSPERAPT